MRAMWVESIVSTLAVALALATRPWRAVPVQGPPWPWLAWWAVMPVLWGADLVARIPIVQPLSGACLLALMAGWPLAVLAMLPVAALTAAVSELSWTEALYRYVWLGLAPATLAFGLGLCIRRWLPHHLFVYILGRGFFASVLASTLAGGLALWLHGAPVGTSGSDLMVGRWLSAWGDAFVTGMLVAIFVAFRPHWLATYSDQLYLPRD